MFKLKHVKQKGFSLIETTIALAIITTMLTAFVALYDTNRSRAEVLKNKLDDINAGLLRMKADTSCFPLRMDGLVTPAQASNTFCGVVSTDSWRGPYIEAGTTFNTSTGRIKLEAISPSLEVYLDRVVVGAGSSATVRWMLRTEGLTNELKTLLLEKCGTDAANNTYTARCYDNGDGQAGYVLDDGLSPINISTGVSLTPPLPTPAPSSTFNTTLAPVPTTAPGTTTTPLPATGATGQGNPVSGTGTGGTGTGTGNTGGTDPNGNTGGTGTGGGTAPTPSISPAGTKLGGGDTASKLLMYGSSNSGISAYFTPTFYAAGNQTELNVACSTEAKLNGSSLGVQNSEQSLIPANGSGTAECVIPYCNSSGTCDLISEIVSYTSTCTTGATCTVSYNIAMDCTDPINNMTADVCPNPKFNSGSVSITAPVR